MDDKLLVRAYNVGLGDCIYVRVPDDEEDRHILIDCGNVYGKESLMQVALDDLMKDLPTDESGKRRLDLLVITHRHKDHIAAFDLNLEWFKGIRIDNIWLSAAMDPEHPQADDAQQLHFFAAEALRAMQRMSLGATQDALARDLLSVSGYSNDDALVALRATLPSNNGLPGDQPLYVHDRTPPDQLNIFADNTTRFRVLAPAENIDGVYLGRTVDALRAYSGLSGLVLPSAPRDLGDEPLAAAERMGAVSAARVAGLADNWEDEAHYPTNISAGDFRRLRTRLVNNALAFVLKDGELVNNTSLVLLLEWRGRRLLFTGDAQCRFTRKGEFTAGKSNGSWNAMWATHRELLDQPLDYLKVGHHGSHNATPWRAREEGAQQDHPVNQILDAMLPRENPTAKVVLSTERTNSYGKIPFRELTLELGERATNPQRAYSEQMHYTPGKLKENHQVHLVPDDVPQPERTDLHYQVTGSPSTPYVDVEMLQAPDWAGGN